MPITITRGVEDVTYFDPFIESTPAGEINGLALVSTFTTREVDVDGYLKPGVVLQASGALITGAGLTALGMVRFPAKVATGNTPAALAAAPNTHVSLITRGLFRLSDVATNLGSALTANELASMTIAGAGANLIARP